VSKRAYFMTVIDGVSCVGRACYKQTRDAFQPSRLTRVRLWADNTPFTVLRHRRTKCRSWNKDTSVSKLEISCWLKQWGKFLSECCLII